MRRDITAKMVETCSCHLRCRCWSAVRALMVRRNPMGFALVLAGTIAVLVGCASLCADASTARPLGWRSDLGMGTVSSYAEFDNSNKPTAIGIVLSATALDGLPTGSDHHHCSIATKMASLSRRPNAMRRSNLSSRSRRRCPGARTSRSNGCCSIGTR
jgi:hypothetical protein